MRVPVFIITHDRLQVFKKCLASIQRLKHAIPVIIDICSTFEPTVLFIREVEQQGIKVYRSPTNLHYESMCRYINQCVFQYITNEKYYAITDSDIEIIGPDTLIEDYIKILEQDPIYSVSPSLILDDIPDYYPLKQRVIEWETQFWNKPRITINNIEMSKTEVDTTFAIYRTGSVCCAAITYRTFEPYVARHLDWYIDFDNMSDDQAYYLKHANKTSHWGGTWLREKIDSKIKTFEIFKCGVKYY